MTASLLTYLAMTVIGSGGLVGAVVAFVKLRPETDSISITTAKGALGIQADVLASVNNSLAATKVELGEANARIDKLEATLEGALKERNRLRAENEELRDRVEHLEAKVRRLEAQDTTA